MHPQAGGPSNIDGIMEEGLKLSDLLEQKVGR